MKLAEPFRWSGEHIALDLADARVLFTTRRGGFSKGPFESLNLGRWTGDDRACVERNRELLARQLGVAFAYGRQVHGNVVRLTEAPADERSDPAEADGQATAVGGVAGLVLTADCMPVAIAGRGAVAMVHAGWRGLAGGVLAAGVDAVHALGATGALEAAIGPGAGRCCYEVGEEVHVAFAAHGPDVRAGQNLDLKAIARIQLSRAGVQRIHDVGLCTICSDRSLFFSHRRDHGVTGRQGGLAWLS